MPRGATYADNAYNRSVGRAGEPMGSHVISRGSSSSSSSSYSGATTAQGSSSSYSSYRTDAGHSSALSNSINPVGNTSHSSYSPSPQTPQRTSQTPQTAQKTSSAELAGPHKTYVDNAKNRKLERVGLEHGTAVRSKNDNSSPKKSSSNHLNESGFGATPQTAQKTSTAALAVCSKTYVDNAMNRKLGRVGRPIGTAVHSRKTGTIEAKEYVDNSRNRSLRRVGLPRGSAPKSLIKNNEAEKKPEIHAGKKPHGLNEYSGSYYEDPGPVMPRRIGDFEEVNKKDVRLLEKIGEGGFGEVWKAEWKKKIVAVKKLRVQRVSKKCLKDFEDEVILFCTLQHDNIVTFFGACLTTPDVCIVMELMMMSLFEALHEQDDIDFTENDRLSIMLQTAAGLGYLHGKEIAHRDLKTANVLLNYFSDEYGSMCEVKITDFGLSIMKSNIETSQSSLNQFPFGTPRYSAPEVLRGERLSDSQRQVADIYSLGMVFYEIVYMEEPFYNMSYQQLCKQVGEKGLAPEIPKAISVSGDVLDLLQRCWKFEPDQRMTSDQVQREVKNLTNIFE